MKHLKRKKSSEYSKQKGEREKMEKKRTEKPIIP